MVIFLLIAFAIIVFTCYLQTVLSKSRHNGAGLILPAISFIVSIVFSIPNFKLAFYQQFSLGAFIASLIVFLIYNSITIILLTIYWRQRKA